LELSVDAQGRLFLGRQEVASAALEDALRAHATQEPQPRLHIRGDRASAYGHVAEVMAAAHRAGIRSIGFVTEASAP
jgi:biopolymer transport protein ExbD